MKRASLPGQVIATFGMFVVGVYFLLPVWWLAVSSTKSSSALFDSNAFWFSDQFALPENIRQVFTWQDGVFGRWLLNSLLYAGGGALAGTLLAAAAGFALAKLPFRGSSGLFTVIIAALLIPAPLLALPQYLLASSVSLDNTFWAVFIPSVVSPFGVYLAKVYAADSVPDELLDATRVDGSGEIRAFWTVGLRLMSPALVTIFLFQFVAIWNNFFLPLVMLADNSLWPATLGLFFWNSAQNQTFYHLTITGSLISVLPLIVAFLGLNRYWRSGLADGAVKA
ncbi:carbohydrate ABC transporter permease [Streptomyces sp. NPDC060131]|uniref:carbohydrate ABC transporter permease n=1 Tax=unclassified Streptomyces TaxID=2593676 RepID=UPI003662DEFC